MKGLQFSANRGQTVALVGPSGSGKSTCISMLERFYDTTGGAVVWLYLFVRVVLQEVEEDRSSAGGRGGRLALPSGFSTVSTGITAETGVSETFWIV